MTCVRCASGAEHLFPTDHRPTKHGASLTSSSHAYAHLASLAGHNRRDQTSQAVLNATGAFTLGARGTRFSYASICELDIRGHLALLEAFLANCGLMLAHSSAVLLGHSRVLRVLVGRKHEHPLNEHAEWRCVASALR